MKTWNVAVLGAGKIGATIAGLLHQTEGYGLVRLLDQSSARLNEVALSCEKRVLDLQNPTELALSLQGIDAVLNALPHGCVPLVARTCAQAGVHYFDLTEDVECTKLTRELAKSAKSILMPQCGLAPGFINMVGWDLAKRFETLLDLRLRVGALPRFPNNSLRYNLNWSTDGVINEYCNPCDAIVDGKLTKVAALEGHETFHLDGISFEAFNTSGGLGTLTDETLLLNAKNVDYKTIRYPGHCDVMKLLLNELRMRENREMMVRIFDQAIPSTEQDMVVIYASATGYRQQRLVQESYASTILPLMQDGKTTTAIALTTANGICAALDLAREGKLPSKGFVNQQQIGLTEFLQNRFGKVYASA